MSTYCLTGALILSHGRGRYDRLAGTGIETWLSYYLIKGVNIKLKDKFASSQASSNCFGSNFEPQLPDIPRQESLPSKIPRCNNPIGQYGRLVEYYSTPDLIKERDKLIAVSGFAKVSSRLLSALIAPSFRG